MNQNAIKVAISALLVVGVLVVAIGVTYVANRTKIPTSILPVVPGSTLPPISPSSKYPAAREKDGIIQVAYTDVATSTFTYFTKPEAYLTMGYPASWELVTNISTVESPKYISHLQFALRKKGTQCILGYFNPDKDYSNYYSQASFGHRVQAPSTQLDSGWYVLKEKKPENFTFLHDGRQNLPFQVRLQGDNRSWDTSMSQPKIFAIYNEDGSVVSDDCDYEASEILTTLTSSYTSTTLTPSSKGNLFVQGVSGRTSPSYYLSFIDDSNKLIKHIMEYKGDYAPNPIVAHNTLYFTEKGILKYLNVFTGEIHNVQGVQLGAGEEVINEFYIYQDRLFYLSGKNCTDYLERCDLQLFEYNMKTGGLYYQASHITSRDIVEYDPKENALAMYWGDGDAGCVWVGTQIFDLDTKTIGGVENLGYCEGEPDAAVKEEKMKAFFNRFSDQVKNSQFIRVENMKLIYPSNTTEMNGDKTFRFVF